ncbi:MAG: DUF692 domain-containing protein [Rhodocyclaceae bacterium]|nr:DUF692 domain-containing protein [Rhodocyclaceae bacterium]MBX3669819.1 DUF692 domain-containing protein [Rhodocyclaceae bacterium]
MRDSDARAHAGAQPELAAARRGAALPLAAGMGLRPQHYEEFLQRRPAVGFVEVHSENYFGNGGKAFDCLMRARADYAVSLHGVGLSLGSTDELNQTHLASLRCLADAVEPAVVSDHVCWSSVGAIYANDLLPLPYTEEALAWMVRRVDAVQEYLRRPILVENVSSYLEFESSQMSEWDFLAALAQASGCGILLDVNNIYVSAQNHGFDAQAYLAAIPRHKVAEIHLAGFTRKQFEDGEILIDTHSRPVADDVWALYGSALQRYGQVPTLIEWDADLPPLDQLVQEVTHAQQLLEACHVRAA